MRTGSGSLHRVVALAALLGAASGCAGEDAPDPTVETEATDEGPRLTLDAVTWALAWTGVTPGETWTTTNDLGVTFTVDGGFLVDYSASLVHCADTVARAEAPGPDLWSLVGVGTAYAADSAIDDPSTVEPQLGEALAALPHTELGSRTFAARAYCSVHWLIARADAGVQADDGTDLSGTSLRVQGTWEDAEGTGVLDLTSDFTQGVLLPLPEVVAKGSHAEITLVRDAARMFDGLDPRTMNEYAASWTILENLANQVSMKVQVTALVD